MKKFNRKPLAFLIKLSVVCIFLSLLSIQSKAQGVVMQLEYTNVHWFDNVAPYGMVLDVNIVSYVDDYSYSNPWDFSGGENYNMIVEEVNTGYENPNFGNEYYGVNIDHNNYSYATGVTVLYYDPNSAEEIYLTYYLTASSSPTTYGTPTIGNNTPPY